MDIGRNAVLDPAEFDDEFSPSDREEDNIV